MCGLQFYEYCRVKTIFLMGRYAILFSGIKCGAVMVLLWSLSWSLRWSRGFDIWCHRQCTTNMALWFALYDNRYLFYALYYIFMCILFCLHWSPAPIDFWMPCYFCLCEGEVLILNWNKSMWLWFLRKYLRAFYNSISSD